jgi:hypothetical protein
VRGGRDPVEAWFGALAEERRKRLKAIRAMVFEAAPDAVASIRNGTLECTRSGHRIVLANRTRGVAVHFRDGAHIANVRLRHPELDCGVACVRIRDSQYLPLYELGVSFRHAFGIGGPDGTSGAGVAPGFDGGGIGRERRADEGVYRSLATRKPRL